MGLQTNIKQRQFCPSFILFTREETFTLKSYHDWPDVKNVLREMSITCYRIQGEKVYLRLGNLLI